MLGGGVIIQRFGDLIRGRRSTPERMEGAFITPTLNATPGDLSLVLPKRILDDIVEMIYALDKIAPGTANEDTLLYGVEVKFYNMEVEVNKNWNPTSIPAFTSLAMAAASPIRFLTLPPAAFMSPAIFWNKKYPPQTVWPVGESFCFTAPLPGSFAAARIWG